MTVEGAVDFVQSSFPDQTGQGSPGQIWQGDQATYNRVVRTYSNEGVVFCGRAVVKATVQDFSTLPPSTQQPFTVELVSDSSVVADLVGIVARPFTATQNFVDLDTIAKAGFGDKNVAPVLDFASKHLIIVRQDNSIGDVVHAQPVFVMIDSANSFGLSLGEFSNAITANPAHSLLVPNAIWYFSKTTRDNALDPINVIELL